MINRTKENTFTQKEKFRSLLFAPFLFFPHFSPFAGHLLGFSSVGKGFANVPRFVKLLEKKYDWLVEQDSHCNFLINLTCFLLKSCSFGYGSNDPSPCTSQASRLSMTVDNLTNGTRDEDPHERIRLVIAELFDISRVGDDFDDSFIRVSELCSQKT